MNINANPSHNANFDITLMYTLAVGLLDIDFCQE